MSEEILPPDQSRIIEQAKFTYSPLGKTLEKKTKTIKGQGEKQIKAIEEHGKHLVESNLLFKKDSQLFLRQKKYLIILSVKGIMKYQH